MALYTILKKTKIVDIAEKFGVHSIHSIKGIKEGTVNTYYKFTSNHENYYLKIDEVADLKRLKKELKILEILNKSNLNYNFPHCLKTLKNEKFIPVDNKYGLIFYELKGQSIQVPKLTNHHLKQIGVFLATLHLATKNISLSSHRFHLTELKRVFASIKKPLAKKYSDTYQLIEDFISMNKKNHPQDLPAGLIHGDLFAENMLFQNNKLKAILDFEASGKGVFLFDLMVALHALCFVNNKLIANRARALLKGYQSVRKLSQKEKLNLNYYYNLSALRFLLTRLRDFEFSNKSLKSAPYKDFKEYHQRLLAKEKIEKIF